MKSVHDVPQLLIQWSSPWEEFVTAIRPALARSPKPLAGEAPIKIFPVRGIAIAWLAEALLLSAAIIIPAKLASLQPYTVPAKPTYDVIYYTGNELPQTEDTGGAERGKTGRAGGHQALHRTQTIRVARGGSPAEKVVDAPRVNLPKSDLPVANLLAIRGVVGPPPTFGLRSSLPTLPQTDPIAPSPDVARDRLRGGPDVSSSIIAPPPEVSRDMTQRIPQLSTSLVAPPPDVAREKMRNIDGVTTSVVAPPPEVSRDKMRTIQGLNSSVIAPPPEVQQDIAGSRVFQGRSTEVIPPPVSAPARSVASASRLSLPEPSVIAPPPSNVNRQMTSLYGAKTVDVQNHVVPPPVQVSGQISGKRGGDGGNIGGGLSTNVVPPPPSVAGDSSSGSLNRYSAGTMNMTGGVVPPPPSAGGSSLGGWHSGRGGALNGAGDMGSAVAAPKGGGSGKEAGVVVSSQPGPRVGVPGNGGSGVTAMSPTGASKAGLGGSGGGSGIGQGSGSGSGLDGSGTGAASIGAGRGSDPTSRSGISPYPGTGGAGSAGSSTTPGIAVSGGSTINLPSFGASGGAPGGLDPSRVRGNKTGPGITVVASSRSGGAFNFYGTLKGDPVYTIYLQTSLGMAVLQYADPTSTKRVYAQELSAPEPMRATLPAGLTPSRLVIACVLDQEGLIHNIRVLEPGSAQMTASVLAALRNWKFKPAFRADQPVEVNAILGFNIDTR
jgi:Gram-negative bacterial TonB protein C-terminal